MTLSKSSRQIIGTFKWGEDVLALTVFAGLALLPAIETISRIFKTTGIPASPVLVQHLTLWIGFIGAVLAARQNKLLALTTRPLFEPETTLHPGRWLAKTVSFIVLLSLMWGSWELVKVEFQFPNDIAPNIPRWVSQLIMPVGFGLIAVQIYMRSYVNRFHRATMLVATLIWILFALTDSIQEFSPIVWTGIIVLLLSLYFGAPIFVGLGGAAALFFWSDFIPISASQLKHTGL